MDENVSSAEMKSLKPMNTFREMKNAEQPLITRGPKKSSPWYRKITNICFPEEWIDTYAHPRKIWINKPNINSSSLHHFPDNKYQTSKYTLLTFLPKNLFEQFQKAANFYFLIVAIVVSIPGISTIEPYTSILPLVFVLSVTAAREAYEDYHRHKEDNEINRRIVHRVVGGNPNSGGKDVDAELKRVMWMDIEVGDIIKIEDGMELPADLLLLSSSDVEGTCNVMTANLDGETNLKTRSAIVQTKDKRTVAELGRLWTTRAHVSAQPPVADLHQFEGVYTYQPSGADSKESVPLTTDNLLLRGSKVLETEWCFGLVLYTGENTKLVLNSNQARHKRSNVEWEMNKQMYYIFAMQAILILFCAIGSGIWQYEHARNNWYIDDTSTLDRTTNVSARNLAAFFILFNVMIPISLYVSMEIVKVVQSLLIHWDIRMYDPTVDYRAQARTSNLNEELGQIKYIFSDKTGTLTQNKMSFYKCSINGVRYGQNSDDGVANNMIPQNDDVKLQMMQHLKAHKSSVSLKMVDKMGSVAKFEDPKLLKDLAQENDPHAEQMREFCTNMAVCHTVNCVEDKEAKLITPSNSKSSSSNFEYRGVSIDEVALVTAVNEFGFRFTERTRDSVYIDSPWKKRMRYQILNIMDFTSDRKRMSVICRHDDGRLMMYSKGADSEMFKRMKPNQNEDLLTNTKKHLEEFSGEGLRTLVLACRELDEEYYSKWSLEYQAANETIGNRTEKVEEVADKIERDWNILGVTAIEDALQVGVVETLVNLRKAGIKVWMLTGDKMGTAINIARAAGLVDNSLNVEYITATSRDEMRQALIDTIKLLDNSAKNFENNNDDDEKVSIEIEKNSTTNSNSNDKKSQQQNKNNSNKYALVVDGPNLFHALHPDNQDVYFGAINHPMNEVVVCSRMAPKQKASVVRIIKENIPDVITLAVGDGANDVSMIQTAHVGVGIRGKEGLQAVNTSDYAIGQFRFLQRLLLVHGHLSYKRNTKLILYSFYKSMVITYTQFYFTFLSAFSSQEIYDGILLNTFNLFFASLPILAFAIIDQDLTPEELIDYPEIYAKGASNTGFNRGVYWSWITTGMWHAIWVFFIPWYSLKFLGLWGQSMGTYTCLVIAVNFKITIATHTWSIWNHIAIWGSILFWFLFGFAISSTAAIEYFPNLFGVFSKVTATAEFWFSCIFVAWMSMAQDYLYKWWRHELAPIDLKLWIQLQREKVGQHPTVLN